MIYSSKCQTCGLVYDAYKWPLGCPAVHNPPTETEFRLDSQQKEIERLRADKLALIEMLDRVNEFLGDEHNFHATEAIRERVDSLLVKVKP